MTVEPMTPADWPDMVAIYEEGMATGVGTFADAVRYRLTFSLQAQNLTNHNNYTGYSGVLTSPFFGQPTAVLNPRRIVFNIAFNF